LGVLLPRIGGLNQRMVLRFQGMEEVDLHSLFTVTNPQKHEERQQYENKKHDEFGNDDGSRCSPVGH
jgi:hypothetical protein